MYLKVLLFAILFQISGLSLPSKAATLNATKVSAKFSLDKSTFLAGEPIWVTLTITNNDSTGIEVFTSDHQSSVQRLEYVFRATDIAGRDAAPHSDSPPIASGFDNEITIPPGSSTAIRIFLPDWFMMTSPGSFTLSCATTLGIRPADRKQNIEDDCVQFKAATIIPFSVLPPNSPALGEVIRTLEDQSFSADPKVRDEASRDLSVISDERVIPIIGRILANKSFDSTTNVDNSKELAMMGLAQFSSDAAEKALLPALESWDTILRGNASIVLNEMKSRH